MKFRNKYLFYFLVLYQIMPSDSSKQTNDKEEKDKKHKKKKKKKDKKKNKEKDKKKGKKKDTKKHKKEDQQKDQSSPDSGEDMSICQPLEPDANSRVRSPSYASTYQSNNGTEIAPLIAANDAVNGALMPLVGAVEAVGAVEDTSKSPAVRPSGIPVAPGTPRRSTRNKSATNHGTTVPRGTQRAAPKPTQGDEPNSKKTQDHVSLSRS
jgi:hypothetical protein